MADYQHKILSGQSGFTIVELMIVVAIMGILATIAAPSVQKQMGQMKQKDAVNITEMAFKQARDDALVYRANVNVVLNNTSAATQSLQITQMQNSVTNTQSKNFDPKVTISLLNSMPTGVTFTPNKTALNTAAATPMQAVVTTNASQPVGYGFCYSGVKGDQYVVSVDALSNVKVTTMPGGCV